MRFPWANVILLILVLLQGLTGYFGFTNGFQENGWLLWLHGMGGFALIVVLLWKGRIILDVYRRGLGVDLRRIGFAVLAVGLLATLATGYVWTYLGQVYLGGFSLVTVHILLAVGILLVFAWHFWAMRFILRHPASRDRAFLFRSGAIWLGGVLLWALGDRARIWLTLPGARRRFTGSYQTGSPGQFPAYIWIADRPQPVDAAAWRLAVTGEVARPLHLVYEDILGLPEDEWEVILDCTGGWFTMQVWNGVRVAHLLERARVTLKAQSITFTSITGYRRRFSLQEAAGFLLATGVAGERLTHGHGFPLRLVAPGRRGFHWVKWVTGISVNNSSPHWQSPLPLQ